MGSARETQAWLIDVRRASGRQQHPIKGNVLRIGRSRDRNHLVLPEDTVSAEHAVITRVEGTYHIRDLASANGTKLNGCSICNPQIAREFPLVHGDRILIDEFEFIFVRGDRPVPPGPPAAADNGSVRPFDRIGGGVSIDIGPAVPPEYGSPPVLQTTSEGKPERHSAPEPELTPFPAPAGAPPLRTGGRACHWCGSSVPCPHAADDRSAFETAVCPVCVEALREPGIPLNQIAGYDVLRRLGRGGMGEVFLCLEAERSRVWAVKILSSLDDPTRIRRFERETRLGGLCHPNVIKVVESGRDERGRPFLTAEYAAGGNVHEIARRAGGFLSEADVIRIGIECLHGLEYLHERGIIHRDIKPANILCGSARRLEAIKLADFGLARYSTDADGTRLTRPDAGLGTLMFMAPEQMRGAGSADRRADVYSLGASLYLLLTGSYTFDFPSQGEMDARCQPGVSDLEDPKQVLDFLIGRNQAPHPAEVILNAAPVPVRQRRPALSPDLAAIIDRAVMKDPEQRYPTASRFRLDLEAC